MEDTVENTEPESTTGSEAEIPKSLDSQSAKTENPDEDRRHIAEERDSQRQICEEKHPFEDDRRKDMYKSIKDAATAKSTSLTMTETEAILKQNQFGDRRKGMSENEQDCVFDPNAPLGSSQTVTYTSRFIDRLSDITDDMWIPGALSIKAAKIGESGRGSFTDSDKFKESDLTLIIASRLPT